MAHDKKPGSIGWMDLTVPNAGEIRDFYNAVVGWNSSPVSMGEYEDYCMLPGDSADAVAGICYARGENQSLPPVWLPYIIVENLEASLAKCRELGGQIIAGPKNFGDQGAWCAIRDPAGAASALFQPPSPQPSQE